MRAISRLSRLDGISTVSCAAMIALRMRVRKSAMGSVIDMRSPARLGHAGDEPLVRQLAQADPAEAELAVDGARAPAAPAARVHPHLVLLRAARAHDLRCLGHVSVDLLLSKRRPARRRVSRSPPGGLRARTA